MPHDWMIRVLEDLQTYARSHSLTALAAHLDEARLLAIAEIASRQQDRAPECDDNT